MNFAQIDISDVQEDQLLQITYQLFKAWKKFPGHGNTKYLANKRDYSVKGLYGSRMVLFQRYIDFIEHSYSGMQEININALRPYSVVWNKFISREQRNFGIYFKTGKSL